MKRIGVPFVLLSLALISLNSIAATPIRIGTNVWPGYEPLYLARDLNYLNREHIRLVEYPSSTEVLRAFRNRALEAAALTLDEVLVLREAKVPVKVVLVLDISDGGDVILARPEVADFRQLKGKRVAVESGALGAYVLTRALEVNGMALDDVSIAHLDVDAHEAAYLAGEVDAAVTFEPVRTRLLSAGAHEVFSSREIPGEVVDVLVVHEALLKGEHGAYARELVASWFQALGYLERQPQQASRMIARRLKVSPAEALASFEGLQLPSIQDNRRMLGGAKPGLQQVLQRLHNTMLSQELLMEPLRVDQLLSDELLD